MDIMFYSNRSANDIAEYIQRFINRSLNENREISYWLDALYIRSKLYTISIETSVKNDNSEISAILQDICKDYGININTSIYVDIYSETYDTGLTNIKYLAKELLDVFSGDALITDESGVVVFKRRGSNIIIPWV